MTKVLTMVQLSDPYTNSECHNAQRYSLQTTLPIYHANS